MKLQQYITGLLLPLSLGCVPNHDRCEFMSEKNNPVCAAFFDAVEDVDDGVIDSLRITNDDVKNESIDQVVQDMYLADEGDTVLNESMGDSTPETIDSLPEISPKVLLPYTKDEHCIALWHFDWPNEFGDSCNGYKLEDHNTTETVSMKGMGSARVFDGKSYLVLLYDKIQNLNFNKSITIEALVKPNTVGKNWEGDFANILNKVGGNDYSTDYQGFALTLGKESIVFYIGLNTGTPEIIQTSYIFSVDSFTHIAITYDGIKLKLYVNKELKNEKEIVGTIYPAAPQNLLIGGTYGYNGFIGTIDEVRISDIAREF